MLLGTLIRSPRRHALSLFSHGYPLALVPWHRALIVRVSCALSCLHRHVYLGGSAHVCIWGQGGRGRGVQVNGKARPGEHVSVSFAGELLGSSSFPAVADANGEWEVEFNGGGVGHGPGVVTVSGEDGPPIVAKNVMGGDVYFCR